ncbi:MAG: carboxypeptidase-like regulatory domain-containing protein, partial [Pseudomonadota bacterium]
MPKRTTLHVFPVDPDVNPVEEAEVLLSGQGLEIQLEQIEKGVFAVREVPPGDYRLHVEPQRDGFAPQIRPVTLRPGPNSALVSIGRRSDLSFPSADGP